MTLDFRQGANTQRRAGLDKGTPNKRTLPELTPLQQPGLNPQGKEADTCDWPVSFFTYSSFPLAGCYSTLWSVRSKAIETRPPSPPKRSFGIVFKILDCTFRMMLFFFTVRDGSKPNQRCQLLHYLTRDPTSNTYPT